MGTYIGQKWGQPATINYGDVQRPKGVSQHHQKGTRGSVGLDLTTYRAQSKKVSALPLAKP